jgi:hypothetical protein
VGLAPALALADVPRSHIVAARAHVHSLPVKLVHRNNYRPAPAAEKFVERLLAVGRDAAQRLERRR